MRVILRQDISKVGKAFEVIDVSDGYARNYLLPRKLAFPATSGNVKVVENEKKAIAAKMEKEKREAEKVAECLSRLSITMPVEVGEEDRMFGSITAQDIAEAISKEGIEVDRRKIVLDEPIRELGVYQIAIKLHPKVTGGCKLWVVKK